MEIVAEVWQLTLRRLANRYLILMLSTVINRLYFRDKATHLMIEMGNAIESDGFFFLFTLAQRASLHLRQTRLAWLICTSTGGATTLWPCSKKSRTGQSKTLTEYASQKCPQSGTR